MRERPGTRWSKYPFRRCRTSPRDSGASSSAAALLNHKGVPKKGVPAIQMLRKTRCDRTRNSCRSHPTVDLLQRSLEPPFLGTSLTKDKRACKDNADALLSFIGVLPQGRPGACQRPVGSEAMSLQALLSFIGALPQGRPGACHYKAMSLQALLSFIGALPQGRPGACQRPVGSEALSGGPLPLGRVAGDGARLRRRLVSWPGGAAPQTPEAERPFCYPFTRLCSQSFNAMVSGF